MNPVAVCPQCEDPSEMPGHRCLKCLIREHQKLAADKNFGSQAVSNQDCRVTMHFSDRNVARSYRCSRAAARRLMHDILRQRIAAEVTIDDQLCPDLPRLPMEHMYLPV